MADSGRRIGVVMFEGEEAPDWAHLPEDPSQMKEGVMYSFQGTYVGINEPCPECGYVVGESSCVHLPLPCVMRKGDGFYAGVAHAGPGGEFGPENFQIAQVIFSDRAEAMHAAKGKALLDAIGFIVGEPITHEQAELMMAAVLARGGGLN